MIEIDNEVLREKIAEILDTPIRHWASREKAEEVIYKERIGQRSEILSLFQPLIEQAQNIKDRLYKLGGNIQIANSRINRISNELHDFDLSKPLNISWHELADIQYELSNWGGEARPIDYELIEQAKQEVAREIKAELSSFVTMLKSAPEMHGDIQSDPLKTQEFLIWWQEFESRYLGNKGGGE